MFQFYALTLCMFVLQCVCIVFLLKVIGERLTFGRIFDGDASLYHDDYIRIGNK